MKHTNTNGRPKADRFRTMIDSDFLPLFITWKDPEEE